MGNLNYQDVIRDVHDPTNHALQISGTINAAGQATVTLNSSASFVGIVTVANPSSFSGSVTVGNLVSAATIYAVVNTAAAGEASVSLDASVAKIGFATVWHGGNVTLNQSAAYIGLASVNIGGSLPALAAGVNNIGFATVTPVSAWPDPKTYIGLVTVANNINVASTATVYAVVNTGAFTGNVTLNSSGAYIGLVSVNIGGTLPALTASTVNIGLVSVLGGTINSINQTSTLNIGSVSVLGGTINSTLQTSTLNVGSVSVLGGGIGINAGVNNIGFASVTPVAAWPDPKTYIGLVTVGHTVTVAAHALTAGVAGIGFATVWHGGNITLNASAAYIGSVSANIAAIAAGANYVGLVSVSGSVVNLTGTNNIGSVSVLGGGIALTASTVNVGSVSVLGGGIALTASTVNVGSVSVLGGGIGINTGANYIGLVTSWTRNAGTAKTLIGLPITGLSVNSVSTIAVPTNANSVYITSMMLSSDATVRVSIKSGVTYMTGNVSLGVTLFPGGGFSIPGSPDSPSWIGLPSGALVIEKADSGGTIANIGGNLIYFQE